MENVYPTEHQARRIELAVLTGWSNFSDVSKTLQNSQENTSARASF